MPAPSLELSSLGRPLALALGVSAGAWACQRPVEPPHVLRLVRVTNEPRGVFLNERLVFHFSDDLDPVSVHAGSVRVQDAQGHRAAGTLEVEPRRIHFLPAPVTRADLSDGGLRPATDYEVLLRGFPYPGGLRARDGAPLEHTWRWHFRTVDPADPETSVLFEDETPGFARPIALVRREITPGEPISFAGEEPIDPSSLFAEDFELRPARMEGGRPALDENGDPVLGDPIPLAARLRDNRSATRGGSMRFDLQPLVRLEPGHYRLRVDQFGTRDPADPSRLLTPGLRLRDFGGNKVWIADMGPAQIATIVVRPQAAARSGRFREEFLDAGLRSGQAVGGADGTALWSDLGRVSVSYPAAAGDGSDGPRVLEGVLAARDLAATRILVPEGARARIEAGSATVVLRSQGRLEIAGRLERPEGGEPISFEPGQHPTLSDWLARARDTSRGWTVLVAGGDLVVSGEVRVPGGLLLVAGGRVRVSGTVHAWRDHPELDPWRLGAGGGTPMQDASPFLDVDAPRVNSLVDPLVFAVLSGPIPPEGGVSRWLEASVGARDGSGRHRVRFLGSTATSVDLSAAGPVEHPGLLGSTPYLRFLVELELPSASETPRWDPPSVDYVEVTWDRAAEEGER